MLKIVVHDDLSDYEYFKDVFSIDNTIDFGDMSNYVSISSNNGNSYYFGNISFIRINDKNMKVRTGSIKDNHGKYLILIMNNELDLISIEDKLTYNRFFYIDTNHTLYDELKYDVNQTLELFKNIYGTNIDLE